MDFSFRNGFGPSPLLIAATLVLHASLGGAAEAAHRRPAHHAKAQTPVAVHYTPPPFIAIDVASGRIIAARDATRPWYPASVTKLMTVYVALNAVHEGRLTLDTPLVISGRAASMKPSKMGFAPGSQVTLGNALKMLMVKSANDIAVAIAEGVSGSVESFADEMNRTAAAIGMKESHFVNPNGLPDPHHYSSARDMAVLGRALLLGFPQYANLYNIGALQLGEQVIPNHNGLIGRYPGADGMKTGFTCPAGFNLVASATREGRKVIVVVMGDISARVRTAHAADLLDRAFASASLGESAHDLASVGGAPPDLRSEICARHSGKALLEAESEDLGAPIQPAPGVAAPIPGSGALIASLPRPVYDPVPVYVGPAPGYQGPVAGPRPAHTPIGAIAYAPPPERSAAPAPVKPDPKALSMHRAAGKQIAKHDAKAASKPGVKAQAKKEAKGGKSAKSHSQPAPKAAAKPAKPASQSAASSVKSGQN
jgi:D-alanyl-D-alanine carboxypeptidase